MALTLEQQEARKRGIGATDSAIILGLSPYCTPYELWMIKTGRMESQSILNESRTRLRHFHEITIAHEYAAQKTCKLRRVNKTLYHKKYPFMLCHLDRVIIGLRKILECKSSMSFMKRFWGEAGTDQVPPYYIIQVQHQMGVTGYPEADIALLLDIDDFRIYPVQRDEELIKQIEEAVSEFWNHNVLGDIAPPLTTRGDAMLAYPTNNGNFKDADLDSLDALTRLKGLKSDIKFLESEKEKIENKIIIDIAQYDGLKSQDDILATYKANKKGTRSLLLKKEV